MLLLSFFLTSLLSTPSPAWYYPMTDYEHRHSLKNFGDVITDAFYKGKEKLFPFNRFYGIHSGTDLETLPSDTPPIPVYAVTTGEITYIGSLSGYGGVILLKLPDNHTALYGHVKIKNLSFQLGDTVPAGTVLTYLGNPFSSETSKERQHLHFGIHKGTYPYFHGHEATTKILNAHWTDPTKYLESMLAMDPLPTPTPTISIPTPISKLSLISHIVVLFQKLFNR